LLRLVKGSKKIYYLQIVDNKVDLGEAARQVLVEASGATTTVDSPTLKQAPRMMMLILEKYSKLQYNSG